MRDARKGGGWRWFALLCLIAASRWVLEDQWPEVGSTLRSEMWACVAAAGLALVVTAGMRRAVPSLGAMVKLLAVGGGLLAAPMFSAAFGAAGGSFNRTVALCFVPTIATVLSGIWSDGSAGQASLWPGLAGLAGALLVFPLVLPESVFGYVTLLAPVIVVSAACVACRRVARGVAGEWSAALLFAGGAICLGVIEAGRMARSDAGAGNVAMAAVVFDAVLTGLAVFVVLRMEALRYTSRYFVIPLLTIVEGVTVFRSGVTLRLCAGLVLLAVAAGELLRERSDGGITSGLGLS